MGEVVFTNQSLLRKNVNNDIRANEKNILLTKDVIETIDGLIRDDLSPEQVVDHCKKNGIECVSAETIYLHIWKDKGNLFTHLANEACGQISNHVSFD